MTDTHYLPGDRVQTTDTKVFGTVKEKPESRKTAEWATKDEFIYLDADTDNYEYFNRQPCSLIRQPIEPGCHARWNAEGHANYIGKVVDIQHCRAQPIVAIFENSGRVPINQIVRVAEPEAFKQITDFAFWVASEMDQTAGTDDVFDVAKRIMTEQREAIQQAARRITVSPPTDENRAWLAQYAPEKLKPVFKRGDLVTWGHGVANARITNAELIDMRFRDTMIEVMYVTSHMTGTFTAVRLCYLRHVDDTVAKAC